MSERSVLLVSQSSGAFFGSIERLIVDIARWLRNNPPWMCHIVNISPRFLDETQTYVASLKAVGFELRQCVSRYPLSVSTAVGMSQLVRSTGSGIVHANGYKSDFYGLIAARLLPATFVSTLHTWTEHDWKDRFYSRVDQFLLRYAHICIAVSDGMKQIAVAKGIPEEKIVVVHNWVDPEVVKANAQNASVQRSDLVLGTSDVVLLVPARLSPEKGHIYLIKALQSIVPKYPQVKALFAGAGFYREHLEEAVRKAGLEKHVYFLGFRQDIHAIMALSDWVVLPSFKEGLPLSPGGNGVGEADYRNNC